jgi:hypothetical protein
VLEQRTTAYRAWVRRITDERGISVLAGPRCGTMSTPRFSGSQPGASRSSSSLIGSRRGRDWKNVSPFDPRGAQYELLRESGARIEQGKDGCYGRRA